MVRVSTSTRTGPRFLPDAYALDALTDRLRVAPAYLPRLWWIGPAAVLVLAALLRFVGLAHPNAIVFDETYYAKDGYSLLHYGYERSWSADANGTFVAGSPETPLGTPEYVVHPPLGKWMIALGMALFGDDNPVGWRFSAALFGTLSIALLMWVAWMMFRSITLASIAGLLMAVDGLHLVQSRLALLDVFLMFWLLAAFACLVADRIASRRKLARLVAAAASPGAGGSGTVPSAAFLRHGPWLGVRWCRVAAGLCCGAALGVKWNALFFVAAFGIMTVLWDIGARRAAGIRNWFTGALLKDSWAAAIAILGTGLATYLVTWSGWFASSNAYDRNWAAEHPGQGVQWLPPVLRSLWEYHRSAYEFHTHLDAPHTYASPAWQWLILARPTSYYYESSSTACGQSQCSEAILNIGNPLIWWSAAVAMVFVLIWWILKRDWRMGAIFCVFAVGYFPWFAYPDRTMFYFYALSFLPWLVLGLTAILGLGLGRPGDSVRRRRYGLVVVGGFLCAVLLISAHFWPIWTGSVLTYDQWREHMWFRAWI